MSERDYMAEFNEASSRSRDILIEAGAHVNYLRSLLRDLLPYLPKDHPWLPGINEQIEALPVDERDATIAALQEEIRTYLKWRDALSGMVVIPVAHLDALEAEVERYKAIALLRGWLLEPPSGETSAPVDIATSNRELCENEGHVFDVPMRECFRCHAQFALAAGAGDAGLIAAASAP